MAVSISLPTIGFILATFIVVGYLLRLSMLPKPIPGIPYKLISATRILGDAPDLFKWKAEHGDSLDYLASLSLELNTPVFQMFLRPLGRPWVVVMEPRESYDIMTKRLKDFDRSKFFGEAFKGILPDMHAHMPTGDQWHANRRLINDTMSPAFLNAVAGPQMWTTMQSLVTLWREKARLAEQKPFKAASDIHKCALDIIWAATFGQEIGSNKAQTAHLATMSQLKSSTIASSEEDESIAVFPETQDPDDFVAIMALTESMEIPLNSIFPRQHHWLALRLYPHLSSARRTKDRLILEKLEDARQRFASASAESMEKGLKSALDLVVAKELKTAEKEKRSADTKSRAIQDELFGFLVAGHETTSNSVCWALKLLTEHQDVQTNLRLALQSAFKEAHKAQAQPTIENITATSVPYLEAVIEEVGRRGLTSVGKIRQTLHDTNILGYHIPKGIDVFLMNNGPGYVMKGMPVDESKRSASSREAKDKFPPWDASDIEFFKPDRWLIHKDGKIIFNPSAGPSHNFGAGPRACFGKKWALLELRIILVLIFWNFELLPTPVELSDHRAIDGVTHRPEKTYVRLKVIA